MNNSKPAWWAGFFSVIMNKLLKKLGRLFGLTAVALLTLPSWTATMRAQGNLPDPVYPVVHDKDWYDNPQNVAPFQWKDQYGVVHTNKISDPATNPLHIIALLSYVYTNPNIPGMNYAIPDSAGMENIYHYFPEPNTEFVYNGWGDHGPTLNGLPVRTNNLSTKVDYTRHVRDDKYTGDVTPSTQGSDYNYELSLDANRNGMQLWAINNPFFRTENTYNNATGNYEYLPVVDQPYEHGLTVFLVKLKDTYDYLKKEDGSVSSVLGNGNHTDRSINEYGVVTSLYNSIANEIESIRLITNAVRIEDNESKQNHNSGTLYSVTEPDVNRFYFLAKGTPRQTVKMPTKPLFEEFSPISSLLNGWEMDFYNELMAGKVFTMQHDCSSVPEQAHAFSMHGLNPAMTTHRDLTGVTLWIPDYRMEYWEYGKYKQLYGYDPVSKEGFGRDLFKKYGGTNDPNKKEVYRVIRYFNYNPMHMPTLALYTCKLQADAQPNATLEHTYDVTLDWSTTVSRIAGSNEAIPEDFDVYRVVNGVREDEPLFSFVYDEDGYCQVLYNNTNLSEGEAASSRSRSYEHIYQVPQNKDEGYWITYQVFARVHKANGETETFANVLSNTDRVWIPPYDAPTPVQLNIELNTSSEYVKEREVNRYVNTIKIANDEINPLKLNQVQARPNDMGWNPNANGGQGGFQVANGESWQYNDNELCSEIVLYRFNRDFPDEKVKVAQVKFHRSNPSNEVGSGNEWFDFDVRRFNQAESATEGEYVYAMGNTNHPWGQGCKIHYDTPWWLSQDQIRATTPFNFANKGYPLGYSEKDFWCNNVSGGDYQKGIMVTDIFEASTEMNDHPEQYGYIAEFHKYINDTDPRFVSETAYSNKAFIDVYKSISEADEFTFTKDDIDNNDRMHELELGYKAGLTISNMLYLPEIYRYDIYSRTLGEFNALNNTISVSSINSYAKRDTHNTYLVYASGNKVDEPEQFQSAVTIPDKSRVGTNMDAMYYVPVITANLPNRAVWMANGNDVALTPSTYGSNYHGTGNTLVWLASDREHSIYQDYLLAYLGSGNDVEVTDEMLCIGNDIEHAATSSGDYYGHFMEVTSEMSPNLEVYGVRVWRVRDKDADGNTEDVLVNEWFVGDDMDKSSDMAFQPAYFVVSPEADGSITVSFKDGYRGPEPAILSNVSDYQPKYIVHFYGRMRQATASMLKAGDGQQAKTYYVSEKIYLPTIPDEIPTAIGSTMASRQVVSVKYFDMMGRVSFIPFKGVNIVVTSYDDGTTITTKQVK